MHSKTHQDLHRHLLRQMLLCRESDLREDVLVRQGKGGPHVSSRGHEALIAITALLDPRDQLFAYYRGGHLLMGKGIERETIARDFLYRRSSTSGARSMSVHAGSRELGVFPTAAPVPSQCLPAVGTAWAQRRRGERSVTVCSLGDGATRAGEFYEALSFAVQQRLPILFVVEDNGWAISTSTAQTNPLALGVLDSHRWQQIDGTDVHAVLDATSRSLTRLREGQGPQLLWCRVHRIDPHTSNEDHTTYRTTEELDALVDPVDRFAASLLERGELSPAELDQLKAEARDRARVIYRAAAEEPDPEPASILTHMYGEPRTHRPVPFLPEPEATTMVAATQRVLQAGLASFDELLLFGQDIEDPKGGVFGFTKGLSDEFPGRVLNAPIAEATIIGSAVGLAAQGVRPVFEIQFIDFLAPGFNQLVTHAASLRWRSLGQWTCPMVIYAPYGSYIPRGGLWHSQSNEGWWTHIPGLRVAVPSTPQDLVGLFWSAFQDDDPTLLLIPKFVFRIRHAVPAYAPVPFGQARIARDGHDLTLVAWGNAVSLCEQAAERVASQGISAEVIDLRTLVPCDYATIEASVGRTGRLVVVQEDSRSSSFGGTIVSELVARAATFDRLLAPPQLVSREDVHIPCDPALMEAVLPAVDDIVAAIDTAMRHRATSVARVAPSPAPNSPSASHAAPAPASPPPPISAQAPTPTHVRQLVVPTLGEGIREVRIIRLLKAPGDAIAEDEPLYELESDKATSAIESPGAGRLLTWLVEEDDLLTVGDPVARLELHHASATSTAELPPPDRSAAPAPPPATPPATSATATAPPSPRPYREIPLSERQRVLNASFRRSRERAIPATIFSMLSLEGLTQGATQQLRTLGPESDGYVTAFEAFALCTSRAAVAHPRFRSVLAGDRTRREYASLQLGVAVAGPDGDLLTAVVDDADTLDLATFRRTLRAAINDAMEGRDQATDTTQLLLTYLGDLGVLGGVPLLIAPAAAVISFGCPYPQSPQQVQVSLSFEHQLINGVEAASFLQTLAGCVRDLADGRDPQARPSLSPAMSPELEGQGSELAAELAAQLATQLREMPDPDAARARVEQHLAEHLAALTQRPAESLPPDAPFAELGLTSLNLLQLRTRLEQSLGITVPVAIFWSAFTQTALAEHLLQALRAAPDSAPASHPVQATASTPSTTPPPDSPPRSDDAARIAALDDDALAAELDRLIDASSVSTPNPARTSGTKH